MYVVTLLDKEILDKFKSFLHLAKQIQSSMLLQYILVFLTNLIFYFILINFNSFSL